MLDKLNSEECEMCVLRESIRGQNSWRNTLMYWTCWFRNILQLKPFWWTSLECIEHHKEVLHQWRSASGRLWK